MGPRSLLLQLRKRLANQRWALQRLLLWMPVKKLTSKIINPPKKSTSKKLEEILNKYTTNGSAIDIQDLVKKLNSSELKKT